MKGVGNREKIFTPFHNHAHELYRRHHPQILIIVKPCIAKDRAQQLLTPFHTPIPKELI